MSLKCYVVAILLKKINKNKNKWGGETTQYPSVTLQGKHVCASKCEPNETLRLCDDSHIMTFGAGEPAVKHLTNKPRHTKCKVISSSARTRVVVVVVCFLGTGEGERLLH